MKRAMLIALTIIACCLLLLLGMLWAWSPGKPIPFFDENGKPLPGSISEKIWVDINGVQQGMFIRGKDRAKPVLLYLNGGMPDYFLTQQFPTRMEDDFVVVGWEQRGAGLSYHTGVLREEVTTDLLISDIIATTKYLRRRFGHEKIYLMGHSGGTFTGIQAAARAP